MIWNESDAEGKESAWERVLKKLRGLIRNSEERGDETSMVIIDSQSVQNTESAEERGKDPNKKKAGIKRHIGVDILGLPHAVYVTAANVNDRAGAKEMIERNFAALIKVKKFLSGGGCEGGDFARGIKEIHGADVEAVKRCDLSGFHVIPKRRAVERSFARLDKYRRMRRNCERKLSASLQVIPASFVAVLINRF
jgi:transposase